MRIIGLLGGVASGKSAVAEELRQLGATVLDADRAGHEVLLDPEVRAAARVRWGDSIFDRQGQIIRPELAAIVFGQSPAAKDELASLESLTHPRIRQRLLEQLEKLRGEQCPIAILDAPVMLKAGWDRLCDEIVFVDAPAEVRRARARQRGWTDEQFAAREAAQEPLDVKRQHATRIVDNSGDRDELRQQIGQLWEQLLGKR